MFTELPRLFIGVLVFIVSVKSLKFVRPESQKPYLQVNTKSGIVQGIRLKSEAQKNGYYYAYMGIPFAQPPVGPLRFKAPKWAENWSGVLDGSREGSGCIEIYFRLKTKSDVGGNEDCLYINVFTKNNPRRTKRLTPVLVFIYGGAFIEGTSEIKLYGPDLLVSKDVVVVSFNYRLGVFGFLSTEDLAAPGNYGLKDQNLALRWVQKNIRNFGGDPNSVTIFGQSAGAVSVHFHLLSPKSRGLFHRAIMDSGSVLCHWGSQKKPRNIAYLLGVANGIVKPKDSEDLVERLRQIDIEELKYSQIGPTLAVLPTATVLGLPYAPTIEPEHDDAFISKDYWFEMLEGGDFNQVPVMMGITSNETLFFLSVLKFIKPFLVAFDIDPSFQTPPAMNISDYETSVQVGKMVSNFYLGPQGRFGNVDIEALIKYSNNEYFTRPIRKTGLLMAKYVPLYFYYFSYEGILGAEGTPLEGQHQEFKGVGHAEELYYLFNKLNNISRRQADYLVRNRMLLLWTNFAKYGNPTPQKDDAIDNIIWPTVTASEEPRMKYLEINETLAIRETFNEQIYLDWWEEMFKKYAEPPLRTY